MTSSNSIETVDLSSRFFRRSAPIVAKDLLGRLFLHRVSGELCGGIIVETEAYDETDPASHSCHGKTDRNQMMFGSGGISYVYRSYGVHWCFNVSVGKKDYGAAVLIRAIEPIVGIEIMTKRREKSLSKCPLRDIARGPGRLCQAMGIDLSHNGQDLLSEPLFMASPQAFRRPQSLATPRVGISKAIEVPWRFCIKDNPFVSGPKLKN